LAAGHGLYALLWASLAFHGLSGVCGLVITRAYVGTFSLAPALFSVRTLRILYGFGLKVQVSTVALWVAQNFDKLLISKFLGLTYVTYYAIGTRLVYLLRELPMLSFAVLIPKASEMSARNEMEGLKRLYVTGTWAVIAFCAACVGALAVPAYSVLALWLRTAPHPLSVYTFNVVLVGALCHVTSGFACSILRGMGRLKYEIAGNSVMAAANVVFSTLLMFAFGFKGVVLGTLIAFLISPLVLLPAANRVFGIRVRAFLSETLLTPCIVAAVSVGLYAPLYARLCHAFPDGDLRNGIGVAGAALVAAILLCAAIFLKHRPQLAALVRLMGAGGTEKTARGLKR